MQVSYPIVYSLTVGPWTIIRWSHLKQEAAGKSLISSVVIFIFGNIFTLSGVFNAIMYLLTRKLLFWPEEAEPMAPGHVPNPAPGPATTTNGSVVTTAS